MDYSSCTFAELRRFVKARRVIVFTVRGKRHKPNHQDYVAALQRADQRPPAVPFDFLGLPAEARNIVYRLLVSNGTLFDARPNIVQACRQTHREASSILYGENTFTIRIGADGVKAQGVGCGRYGQNHRRNMVELDWPTFLGKARQIRITCHHSWLGTVNMPGATFWSLQPIGGCNRKHAPGAALINNILYSLCCFLEQHDKISSFEIDLDSMIYDPQVHYADCTCIEASFRPLRILSSLTAANIQIATPLLVPQPLQQRLTALWTQAAWTRHDPTPLRNWADTINRAEACGRLSASLHDLHLMDAHKRTTSAQEMIDALEPIASSLQIVEHKFMRTRLVITPTNEQTTITPLRDLKTALDLLDIGKVRVKVTEHVMRKARRDLVTLGDMISQIS